MCRTHFYHYHFSGCVIIANRFHPHNQIHKLPILSMNDSMIATCDQMRIVTWNIGYAGMDQSADFYLDGGSQYRPKKKALVVENIEAIIQTLSDIDADIMVLQEVAYPSWNTYRIDVYRNIREALPQYNWVYSDELYTRWVPPPFSIRMGNTIASRFPIEEAFSLPLPLEDTYVLGVFRKHHRLSYIRFSYRGYDWTIGTVHLAAFDEEETQVREQQVQQVLDFASGEHALGRMVIIGGDWNVRLIETSFDHTTPDEALFWIRDLPQSAHLDQFQWITDEQVPTVRTAHQPYVRGDNYTLVIDGYLVSKEIPINSIRTLDLNFSHTDHHPVVLEIEFR